MGYQLTFAVEGQTQLSRHLLLLADRIKDWTPAMQESAEYLQDTFSGPVFDTEGSEIQEHWSPLKKAYALQKAKKYPGKGILERTGAMRDSFMTLWRPDMAQVWNKATYFKYHQSNGARSSNLPRRVMIKLAETQREQVVKVFQNYFQEIATS